MVAFAIVGASMLFTSCSSSTDKVDNAEQNVQDAKRDLEHANESQKKDVEAYNKIMAEKIAAQEQIIQEFNERIKVQKSDAKKEYEERIAELDKKNSDMKKKMADFNASNQSNWETFKASYNTEMNDLGYAFDELKSKMGADNEPKK